MLVNGSALRTLLVGFKTLAEGVRSNAKPLWDQVAMLIPSTAPEELYGWLGKFPGFREWVGDRVLQNLTASKYRLTNVPYENTITVNKDDIADDRIGLYRPMFEMLGHSAAMHPDKLVFDALKNGHQSLCYDGQNFFDTDHPVTNAAGVAASVANDMGGGGTPWYLLCTSAPIKPLIFQRRQDYEFVAMDGTTDEAVFARKEFRYGYDARLAAGYGLWQQAVRSKQTLDATGYAAARAAMMAFKADGGEPLGLVPNLLVVPPALEGLGKAVLEADFLANGGTNVYAGTAKLLVSPHLA